MIRVGSSAQGDGDGEDRPRRHWKSVIALAILIFAGLLRFAECGRPSMWNDEVVAMRMARSESISDLLTLLRRDRSAAPLHPFLLHGWVRLFGPSDLSGRTLSALLGTLAVAAGFWAAREAFGGRAALLSAWLLAICPLAVQYAQETRMYSLLLLLTCLAWALLFSFRRSVSFGRQVGFAACLAGLFYAHPLGVLMISALAIAYLADRGGYRLRLGSWLMIHAGFVAMALPWVTRYLDHPPQAKPGFSHPSRYLTWPQLLTGGNGLAAWIAYALILLGLWRFRKDGNRGVVIGLACWFLIPVALLFGYSQARVSIFGPPRYLLFVGPAFLILLARGLDSLRPWPRRIVLSASALAATQALWLTVYAPEVKPGWRDAAAAIRQADPAATVVVRGGYPSMYPMTLRYYLGNGFDVLTAREWSDQIRDGRRQPSATAWFIHDRYYTDPGRPEPFDQYRLNRPLYFDRIELIHGRLTTEFETASRPIDMMTQ